jgi:Copper transport outer membrane protein, MctB
MGYSARYHAASLAAVFLALAIGLLIGAGIGDEVLSSTSEDLERSLESDLNEAREREDELQAELERERTFGLRIYPAVAGDRLRGETVGVVALGGLPEDLAGEIEATVEPTGGRLAKVAVIRQPPDLSALAGELGERYRDLETEDADVERLGRRFGAQLVRGGGLLEDAREQLVERFSGREGDVDNVILVAQPDADETGRDAEMSEAFESGVMDGIRAAGRPAVGVELRTADPSTISTFEAHDIPTSDSLELTSGKIAAVFALLGAEGNFGIKESADALLPDVVLEPEERGPGGTALGRSGE